MPIPENLPLYGDDDTLNVLGHRQPRPNQPIADAGHQQRNTIRTVTIHFTHRWKYIDWNYSFANDTSIGIEMARFGATTFANNVYIPSEYPIQLTPNVSNRIISKVNYTSTDVSGLENSSSASVVANTRFFNAKKIPVGALVQSTGNSTSASH